MAQLKQVVTIIKRQGSIDLKDLQVTESEYNILVRVLDWLRRFEYGELELVRHEDKISLFIKEKERYQIDNPDSLS